MAPTRNQSSPPCRTERRRCPASSSRSFSAIPSLAAAHGRSYGASRSSASDDDYWRRAASLRRDALIVGIHASVPDALIAQICIDYDLPLITYDPDFRHFVPAGLKLA